MNAKQTDVVTASEIAAWAWCPESWRLDSAGAEPGNRATLARGTAFHAQTSLVEVWTRRTAWAGVLLVAVALLIATIWYVLARGPE